MAAPSHRKENTLRIISTQIPDMLAWETCLELKVLK